MTAYRQLAGPAAALLLALFVSGGAIMAAEPAAPASEGEAAATMDPTLKAIDVSGIHYDAQLNLGGTTLSLNGAGLRKIVFFKVYSAGLYVSHRTHDPSVVLADAGPRRVRLGLLRNVSGPSFIEALEEGLNANLTEENKTAIENELTALKGLMTAIGDVKEGDIVDFDYTPQLGTIVSRNGAPVGDSIAGKPLFDAVLAIWLGERPIDKGLKASMLGLED